MAPEETTPLIRSRTASRGQVGFSAWKTVKTEMPLMKILIALFLFHLATFGPLASRMDRLRSYVCADFYHSNPDLIQIALKESQSPCAIPSIEKRVANFSLAMDLIYASAASLGLLVYSSMISTKGRKPVFYIGVCGATVHYLPYAVLPLDYPFSLRTGDSVVNPRTSLYLLLASSVMAGLLAYEHLALLVTKALVADISSPQVRMRNLTWLMTSVFLAAAVGPICFSAILSFLPSWSSLITKNGSFKSIFPSSSEDFTDLSSHNNVVPFLIAISLQIVSAIWVFFMVKETAGLTGAERIAQHSPSETRPGRLSVLSALLPKMIPSQGLRKDWRITKLTLVGQAGLAGAMGLQALIMFVGFLGWTPGAVGVLVSWMGTFRVLVLVFLTPLASSWLSRVVKRPRELLHLSQEEMDRINKNALEIQAEIAAEEELEEEIASHQQEGEVVQAEAQELREMQENLERDESLRRQLSLWRANVDLELLKLSFFLDSVGWTITFLGASTLKGLPIYLGAVFVSFGASATAAMTSIGIAMVTDMQSRGYHVGKTPQEATDRLLGAVSIIEACARIWAPIVSSIVYQSTLSSLPGASFLFSALMYAIALALLFDIKAGN